MGFGFRFLCGREGTGGGEGIFSDEGVEFVKAVEGEDWVVSDVGVVFGRSVKGEGWLLVGLEVESGVMAVGVAGEGELESLVWELVVGEGWSGCCEL